jgi:RimJ/RimL family protein N-acetyltransferase
MPLARYLPAGPEDAEAMAAMALDIWRRCWCPSVLTAEEIEYFWRRAYRPEVLREHMNNGAVYEWIEADGRKAGFVAYSVEAEHNRLQLGKLYLLPEYHGRDIGSEALARLQSLAAELAVLDIWLYCFRKNEQAVRAYLRAGFVVERAEISDCGNGFYYDDLVMVWRVERG